MGGNWYKADLGGPLETCLGTGLYCTAATDEKRTVPVCSDSSMGRGVTGDCTREQEHPRVDVKPGRMIDFVHEDQAVFGSGWTTAGFTSPLRYCVLDGPSQMGWNRTPTRWTKIHLSADDTALNWSSPLEQESAN